MEHSRGGLEVGIGCGNEDGDRTPFAAALLKRTFCCSIKCCYKDPEINEQVDEIERIKDSLNCNEFRKFVGVLDAIEAAKEDRSKLRESFVKEEEEEVDKLQRAKAMIAGKNPPPGHVLCQSNYLKKLDMIMEPYVFARLSEEPQQRCNHLIQPSQYGL